MITRRDLVRRVARTVGLVARQPGRASGEPPPETTRLGCITVAASARLLST